MKLFLCVSMLYYNAYCVPGLNVHILAHHDNIITIYFFHIYCIYIYITMRILLLLHIVSYNQSVVLVAVLELSSSCIHYPSTLLKAGSMIWFPFICFYLDTYFCPSNLLV